ncbi:hypothetical protein BSKO_12922 [Bryopsis sp. KO-2023]|nr:hypothetical protein BSKO_12922 [Bryopsis sp. KO-2023]
MATEAIPRCFDDLPGHVVLRMLSFLTPKDLANVSLQSQRFYELTSDERLWEDLYCRRWQDSRIGKPSESWKKAYRIRQSLPERLLVSATKIHDLRERSALMELNSSTTSFQKAMELLFPIVTALKRSTTFKLSLQYKQLADDLEWWISNRPQESLEYYNNGGFRSTDEVLGVNRIAVAIKVAVTVVEGLGRTCPSLIKNLQEQLRSIEESLSSLYPSVVGHMAIPSSLQLFRDKGFDF